MQRTVEGIFLDFVVDIENQNANTLKYSLQPGEITCRNSELNTSAVIDAIIVVNMRQLERHKKDAVCACV
jgi:hypothetical protein